MKVTEDGEQADDSALSIVLVFFDVYQKSIEVTIRRTMEEFLSSLQSELSRPFYLSTMHQHNPLISQFKHKKEGFCPILHEIDGSIKIGITEIGIWDPVPPSRFLYGVECDAHASLLSLYRFRQESTETDQLLQRLRKATIKIFGVACGLYHCDDPGCFLTYHMTISDLDTGMYACRGCRDDFIRALQSLNSRIGA
ncbi:MAG: hypothetical protein KBA44_06120 [Methanoculleus sp.]|nr:hypothetical protein [Methanoculleus sp.]